MRRGCPWVIKARRQPVHGGTAPTAMDRLGRDSGESDSEAPIRCEDMGSRHSSIALGGSFFHSIQFVKPTSRGVRSPDALCTLARRTECAFVPCPTPILGTHRGAARGCGEQSRLATRRLCSVAR